MKRILKLMFFAALFFLPLSANARVENGYADVLLETLNDNEIVLNSKENAVFPEQKKSKKFFDLFDNDDDDDDSVMDNTELDFEIFKMFDKDNDNVIDEDTLIGKIYHSKITRTDVPSYLYKDDLSFKFENGPIQKIQVFGAYRGSISGLFKSDYSTEYDNLNTQVGVFGQFKNPEYKFKLSVSPIPNKGLNYIDGFISDAYIMNTSIPHHQIVAGYSRVQTGVEGGTSSYILPFVARSQIARNFGSARSLAVKVIGNYQYMDYNLALGSSGRYITSGMPGAEFNGWVNFKPFGHKDKKLGKLTIGGGFNGGHNRIDYGVGSVYVGYKYKKLWTNFEAAIADGYNGSLGISENKACGFAATVGWKFNPHWQLIGRIDQFDPNRDVSNDLRREYSIGLNWFIKGQALKLVFNYVFCQNQNRPDSHKLILATQILL